jgi:thiamine biosynthesis lipoprotein
MSFHEPDSDISRINRAAVGETTAVDPRTFAVLQASLRLSGMSDGIFDITVAAGLVDAGVLPRPEGRAATADATWRDVELYETGHVRLRSPLWIDLGGIAKGYAVDQAVRAMNLPDDIQCSVNAGGDLRVSGPKAERVLLRAPGQGAVVPVVELENASLASSESSPGPAGPHFDGATRRGVGMRRFASVVAEDCMTADALTKIVLAMGCGAGEILARHGATAYLNEGKADWETIGAVN